MKYELEGFGIKVILIEPGAVKTNFLDNAKQAQMAMNPDSPSCADAKLSIEVNIVTVTVKCPDGKILQR